MKPTAALFVLYLAICLVTSLKIISVDNFYQTHDSAFYVRTAENLLAGKGPLVPTVYPFDGSSPEVYSSTWPPGYPVVISLLSVATGLNPLIASKIANLLAVAFIFVLLKREFGDRSLWACSLFCTYGALEIVAHTWSETWFLLLLIVSLVEGKKLITQDLPYKKKKQLILALALVGMVLMRYVGLIYLAFAGIYSVGKSLLNGSSRFYVLTLPIGLASLASVIFLWLNHSLTGYHFGFPRISSSEVELEPFFVHSLIGIVNELFLFRKSYPKADLLFYCCLAVQSVFLFLMVKLKLKKGYDDLLTKVLFSAASIYLLMILLVEKLSPIDHLDYRLLAPFSLIFYLGLVHSTEASDPSQKRRMDLIVLAFATFSLLINLPKTYLLDAIFGIS